MGALPVMSLIGVAVVCLGELLHIIGLATPSWMEDTIFNVDANSGLFRSCMNGVCVDNVNSPDVGVEYKYFEVVQAMCILGMLAGLVAAGAGIAYLVLTLLSKPVPSMMGLITLACGIAAFVFVIIGVIVYAEKIKVSAFDYGFSFGLTITGGILMLAGGIIFYFGAKSSE